MDSGKDAVVYCALQFSCSLWCLFIPTVTIHTTETSIVIYRRPGDDVIVHTAGSCGGAKERMESKQEDVARYD
jgi:hypothetical protein